MSPLRGDDDDQDNTPLVPANTVRVNRNANHNCRSENNDSCLLIIVNYIWIMLTIVTSILEWRSTENSMSVSQRDDDKHITSPILVDQSEIKNTRQALTPATDNQNLGLRRNIVEPEYLLNERSYTHENGRDKLNTVSDIIQNQRSKSATNSATDVKPDSLTDQDENQMHRRGQTHKLCNEAISDAQYEEEARNRKAEQQCSETAKAESRNGATDWKTNKQNKFLLTALNQEHRRTCAPPLPNSFVQEDENSFKSAKQGSQCVTSLSRVQPGNADVSLSTARHAKSEPLRESSAVVTSRSRGIPDGTEAPGNTQGGSDGGDGDDGDEATRRVFQLLALKFSVKGRYEVRPNDELVMPGAGLRLYFADIQLFKRYFEMNGFPLLYFDYRRHSFYFRVQDQSRPEVMEKINGFKDRLKEICFARFCGEYINGIEIEEPEDLVCSFGFEVINGDIPNIPSTWMVV